MNMSQWYSLGALIILAPHVSYALARWAAGLCILASIFGPFIAEWMSK